MHQSSAETRQFSRPRPTGLLALSFEFTLVTPFEVYHDATEHSEAGKLLKSLLTALMSDRHRRATPQMLTRLPLTAPVFGDSPERLGEGGVVPKKGYGKGQIKAKICTATYRYPRVCGGQMQRITCAANRRLNSYPTSHGIPAATSAPCFTKDNTFSHTLGYAFTMSPRTLYHETYGYCRDEFRTLSRSCPI